MTSQVPTAHKLAALRAHISYLKTSGKRRRREGIPLPHGHEERTEIFKAIAADYESILRQEATHDRSDAVPIAVAAGVAAHAGAAAIEPGVRSIDQRDDIARGDHL